MSGHPRSLLLGWIGRRGKHGGAPKKNQKMVEWIIMDICKGAQARYQIGYHIVWGVKDHKHILNNEMKEFLAKLIKQICEYHNFTFYCIGIAPNRIHFFAGAPPKVAPAKIVQTVKSIAAREVFKKFPQIKKQFWGGEFWKNGYYIGTVGEGQTESIIRKYIAKQGNGKQKQEDEKQLKLFF